MQRLIAIALLAALSATAQSALIQYEFTFLIGEEPISSDEQLFSGAGSLTVDTDAGGFTSYHIFSDILSFEWSGFAPAKYSDCQCSGSAVYVQAHLANEHASAELDLDRIPHPEGGSPLAYLDRITEEMSYIASGGMIYTLQLSDYIRISESPSEVPEPSTLALLGLGLAGLVRLRRQQLPNLV